MKKQVAVALLVVAISSVFAINVYRTRKVDVVQARTAEVVVRDMEVSVHATGKIEPEAKETIYSRGGGILNKINISTGDEVKKGDVLARLDPTDIEQRLNEARANLSAKRASLAQVSETPEISQQKEVVKQAQSNLADAENELDYAKQVHEEVGDKETHDKVREAEEEVTKRKEELKSAEDKLKVLQAGQSSSAIQAQQAQVRQAEAIVATLEEQRASTTIRAGMDGIVISVDVEQGQYVNAGTKIAQIADLTIPMIKAEVNEIDASLLAPGQRVRVTGMAFLNETYYGEVQKVAPVAFERLGNQGSRSLVEVDIILTDSDTGVRAGYSVDLEILVDEQADTLVVPFDAVQEKDGSHYVYAVINGRAKKIDVTIGLQSDFYTEIKEGLSSGDKVILSPHVSVEENVRIVEL